MSPSPLGTLTYSAPRAPSGTSAALPFHTFTVAIGLSASNNRTASQAWKPQFSSFWLSAARAYLFIALLAATSFDRMVKTLGLKAWARLHWWGVWIVALSFIFTNGKRIPLSGWYALPVALVVAVIVLRVVAGRKLRTAAALA